MRRMKRISCVLLAAFLISLLTAAFLPGMQASAAEEENSGEVSALIRTDERVDDCGEKDNEDLYNRYIEKIFTDELPGTSEETSAPTKMRSSVHATEQLTGSNARIYPIVSNLVKQVANGTRTNTELELTPDEIGVKSKYTASELGVSYVCRKNSENGEWEWSSDAISAFLNSEIYFDALIIDAVMYNEFPYEYFWARGLIYQGASYGVDPDSYNSANQTYTTLELKTYRVKFSVWKGYRLDNQEFEVDPAGVTRAKTSAANAKKIVQTYSYLDDDGKFDAYRQKICELTSYNYEALEITNPDNRFSDPYQLVYVFDNDPSTKVVCAGYAKAYKYLCDLSDFENNVSCIYVTGDMTASNGDPGPHAWNIVRRANGRNYLVDVTNCDEGTAGYPTYLYMAVPISGSLSSGYTFQAMNGITIFYEYDSETRAVFNSEDLMVGSYINVPPEITTQPYSVTAQTGTTATFKVVANGTGLSYQWQWSADGGKNWTNSSSATTGYNTATLKVSATKARNGYQYRCVVSSSNGRKTTSNAATLTVKDGPKITSNPSSKTVASGSTATFSVTATGSNLKYQWQWRSGSTAAWTNSSSSTTGYNTATLKVSATAARNGYQYRCVVSSGSLSATSSAATLTVRTKPSITSQPSSVSVSAGSTATFKVTATGGGLKYQWQWREKSSASWTNSSSATTGYNTSTLKVSATAARNGYQYRCVVTNIAGTAYSSAATLTVTNAPKITSNPSSVTTASGNTATFKVTATGSNLKYQWQWRENSSASWTNSSSATTGYNTATLKVSATAARNGYQYRCVVTNIAGTAYSSAAKLTVKNGPVITGQPSSVTVTAGKTATFKVTATGNALTYQWQWRAGADGTWAGCTSATTGYNTATLKVTATAARNGYQYRCIVIDNDGKTATSNTAKLTVK